MESTCNAVINTATCLSIGANWRGGLSSLSVWIHPIVPCYCVRNRIKCRVGPRWVIDVLLLFNGAAKNATWCRLSALLIEWLSTCTRTARSLNLAMLTGVLGGFSDDAFHELVLQWAADECAKRKETKWTATTTTTTTTATINSHGGDNTTHLIAEERLRLFDSASSSANKRRNNRPKRRRRKLKRSIEWPHHFLSDCYANLIKVDLFTWATLNASNGSFNQIWSFVFPLLLAVD